MLKQLSVFVENEVGSVAGVTTVLKENGINLRAISAFDSPDYGILRMVVDQPEKAKELLVGQGFAVKMTQVLGVELTDRPGSLDAMLTLLAREKFNLNYIYSFVLRKHSEPIMVVNVPDMERASRVLRDNGIQVVD